ncbi:ras family-domain-containing protein [Coniella lustricola]|uniref:Ras family-domain-containing protein n=1 Tax=Coniella lustricola TaxID=2025994 RepID=A0A2T3AL42_9PEZI|nr:ras family-domain-containing protein [Coniella lustricola]
MASDDSLPTLKLLLIGPSGAGKTALLTKYCEDVFEPESATATIGIDFKIKRVSVRGKNYKIALFDTAGQERFRTLSTSFYRGAHGVLVVYDVTSRTSFASVDRWFDEAELNAGEDVALYLVGTKTDKAMGADTSSSNGSRAVSTLEGQQAAEARGARFCEVSAKTGEGVRTPFVGIIDEIVAEGVDVEGGITRHRGANGVVSLGNGGNGTALGGYGSLCAC